MGDYLRMLNQVRQNLHNALFACRFAAEHDSTRTGACTEQKNAWSRWAGKSEAFRSSKGKFFRSEFGQDDSRSCAGQRETYDEAMPLHRTWDDAMTLKPNTLFSTDKQEVRP